MIGRERLALNRIAAPRLRLDEYLRFAAETGFHKVELRNDLPGRGIIDDIPPKIARKMTEDAGVRVITINALQRFNLCAARETVLEDLKRLLETCREISCPALVLCPNNDPADRRSRGERRAETSDALSAFAPLFHDADILGLVEPLGFGISSLDSALEAVEIVRGCGAEGYKVLLDTFHHHIGPESRDILGTKLAAADIGLVHVSGVEVDLLPEKLGDEHRVLPSERDRMASKDQIRRLTASGYAGDISLEPFSPEIADMPPDELKAALARCIAYLTD